MSTARVGLSAIASIDLLHRRLPRRVRRASNPYDSRGQRRRVGQLIGLRADSEPSR
jgi:hypothetical protein